MLDSVPSLTQAALACVGDVDRPSAHRFADALVGARRVFLLGAGRSGLAARSFVIRLRQLGREAYFVGESATPCPASDDLVILCSASSRTTGPVAIARKMLERKIPLAVVTADDHGASWPKEATVVTIPVAGRAVAGPLGTVFELALQLLFDGLVNDLMARLRVTEAAMRVSHTTLE